MALLTSEANAQACWDEVVISPSAVLPNSVFSADLDGDDDVLSMSSSGPGIAWHENVAGDGSVWIGHSIAPTTNDGILEVLAADMDGDGNADVVAIPFWWQALGSRFVWFENTVGDGSAWTRHWIAPLPSNPATPGTSSSGTGTTTRGRRAI
ncbi:MAG: VCBS repeat-containing protein [bacterium]|nr:VCBS repeat-containing protein [bacterium]